MQHPCKLFCFLFSIGITVTPPDTNSCTCRAALLASTLDLPARAAVMNLVQFNGFYGCSHCLQEGMCPMYIAHV